MEEANKKMRAKPKEQIGKVVSTKMDKTVVVQSSRKIKHKIYGKYVSKTSKFYAHDEKNVCKEGDVVRILETRPLSKNKRWRVGEVISSSEL